MNVFICERNQLGKKASLSDLYNEKDLYDRMSALYEEYNTIVNKTIIRMDKYIQADPKEFITNKR
ncbi:hypothetical protein P3G55_04520 [Leptospira sp. 96542]|nr:hypothetical protein [Leptospira sp. 96542]